MTNGIDDDDDNDDSLLFSYSVIQTSTSSCLWFINDSGSVTVYIHTFV